MLPWNISFPYALASRLLFSCCFVILSIQMAEILAGDHATGFY
jgi:hypothetical protein